MKIMGVLCGTIALAGGCTGQGGAEEPEASVAAPGAVADAPLTLERVALASATVGIGGAPVTYQAVLANRTPSTASALVLQNRIEQGAARRAAGGKRVSCGAGDGELAPGTCTEAWSYHASNAHPGPGALAPGPATLVVELRRGKEVLQSVRVPIVLE
jgi:hypothetical protein